MRELEPLDIRIAKKVEFTDSCWLWHGKKNKNGYGIIQISNKLFLAHRVSYSLFNGPFSKSLGVLHRCDVRNCINPKHLFVGTQMENNKDAASKNRVPFARNHWNSKLSTKDILRIRSASPYPGYMAELARLFKVVPSHISMIISGKHRRKDTANV